jgi:hypothetical protein
MGPEDAAPCRHAGAPPASVVENVSRIIRDLGDNEAVLSRYGVSSAEYKSALRPAIEAIRGNLSASVEHRKRFLVDLLQAAEEAGFVDSLSKPAYGADTVYRLKFDNFGDVAIIQKGCPDGAHSSVRWSTPEWARETYLWWLCDSMRYEPGEHIVKGVNRLRQRFFGNYPDTLSGIIFHNYLCGTAERICPKAEYTFHVNGSDLPPPCIYVMPDRDDNANEWNWDGNQKRFFPAAFLDAFGISENQIKFFVSHVGFQRRAGMLKTRITAPFGPGRISMYRS